MTTSVLEPWDTEAMTNYSPSIGKCRQVGDIPITLSRRLWTMRSAAGKEITAAIFDLLIGRELRVSHGDTLLESRLSRTDDADLEQRAAQIEDLLSSKGWQRCDSSSRGAPGSWD